MTADAARTGARPVALAEVETASSPTSPTESAASCEDAIRPTRGRVERVAAGGGDARAADEAEEEPMESEERSDGGVGVAMSVSISSGTCASGLGSWCECRPLASTAKSTGEPLGMVAAPECGTGDPRTRDPLLLAPAEGVPVAPPIEDDWMASEAKSEGGGEGEAERPASERSSCDRPRRTADMPPGVTCAWVGLA